MRKSSRRFVFRHFALQDHVANIQGHVSYWKRNTSRRLYHIDRRDSPNDDIRREYSDPRELKASREFVHNHSSSKDLSSNDHLSIPLIPSPNLTLCNSWHFSETANDTNKMEFLFRESITSSRRFLRFYFRVLVDGAIWPVPQVLIESKSSRPYLRSCFIYLDHETIHQELSIFR